MRELFLLSRPRGTPFVLLLPLIGWCWAHWDRALPAQHLDSLGWVLVAWTLLNAGTMWMNAALDEDEGDVLFGDAVPVPPYTRGAAWVALGGCVGVASLAGTWAGLCALACAGLSVAYSHPATVWKGHPVLGPLVNVVGYGLLSPLAGWSVVGVATNPRSWVAFLLFGACTLSPYFAAQVFQETEDAARGYGTAVVLWGPRLTLQLSRLCLGVCIGGGMVLAAVGWLPRVCLAGIPLWWWTDRLMQRWLEVADGGDVRWAQRYASRLLWSAATIVALCLVEYARESYQQVPVAGLGTVAGHPSDRPMLPPFAMRAWERNHGLTLEPRHD